MPMQKLATLAALPHGRGMLVEIGETKIMLVRDSVAVRAYGASCPHAGAPLNEGAVCEGRIVCPWHKATFRLADGALLEPPALDPLTRYPVELRGEDVFVAMEPVNSTSASAPDDDRTMLIAGAGAAGATAAAALREFGFGGRIVMIGREPGPPFDRTALSKFVLAGQMPPDEVPPIRTAEFYADHQIERVEAELVRIDVDGRRAVASDGRVFQGTALLIATGGVPSRPDLPGAERAGVHTLRSRANAAAILNDAAPGARAVILGSSFIGLEAASALRERNVSVAVVAPEPVPFAQQFGERIGSALRALHEGHGVVFHLSARATCIEGADRVTAVTLEDGRRLAADLVLIGVGVRPATDVVDGIAREQDGGLRADAGMRIAEGVYAAGDIAAFPLPHRGALTRVEHWRVAQQHARIAARNMLGGDATYDGVPFFWTYHYGKRIEYLGHADRWDDLVINGDPARQEFVAFLVQGGNVAAIVACGRERETAALAEHMRAPLTLDAARAIVAQEQASP